MALTLKKKQRLTDKSFSTLYSERTEEWLALIKNGIAFLDNAFPPGETIREDDISGAITDVVATSEAFRKYTDSKSLREQHWAKDFAEYIVDANYSDELVERKKKGK